MNLSGSIPPHHNIHAIMLWENQAADRIIRLKIYPLYIENRQPFSSRIDLLCKNKQSRRRAGADIESSSAPFHRSRSLDNYILKGESSFLYIYIYNDDDWISVGYF